MILLFIVFLGTLIPAADTCSGLLFGCSSCCSGGGYSYPGSYTSNYYASYQPSYDASSRMHYSQTAYPSAFPYIPVRPTGGYVVPSSAYYPQVSPYSRTFSVIVNPPTSPRQPMVYVQPPLRISSQTYQQHPLPVYNNVPPVQISLAPAYVPPRGEPLAPTREAILVETTTENIEVEIKDVLNVNGEKKTSNDEEEFEYIEEIVDEENNSIALSTPSASTTRPLVSFSSTSRRPVVDSEVTRNSYATERTTRNPSSPSFTTEIVEEVTYSPKTEEEERYPLLDASKQPIVEVTYAPEIPEEIEEIENFPTNSSKSYPSPSQVTYAPSDVTNTPPAIFTKVSYSPSDRKEVTQVQENPHGYEEVELTELSAIPVATLGIETAEMTIGTTTPATLLTTTILEVTEIVYVDKNEQEVPAKEQDEIVEGNDVGYRRRRKHLIVN